MQDLHTVSASSALRLRPGEWVEVRSREDILATLAPDATLDGLPFMPEMLRFCGQRFQVHKRADKTCDSVDKTGGLRLRHTVHLQGLRCDGSGHGGCEAGCLMFWRESWLKRPADGHVPATRPATPLGVNGGCTERDVERAAVVDAGQQIFRCQMTQLKAFTQALRRSTQRAMARKTRLRSATKTSASDRAAAASARRTWARVPQRRSRSRSCAAPSCCRARSCPSG